MVLSLQTLWKPAEWSSVGCVNTLGNRPKWEEKLNLSCLESHFDFAIKMCSLLHTDLLLKWIALLSKHIWIVVCPDLSLHLEEDCFLGKIHRNLSIWRLLERRQERSLF